RYLEERQRVSEIEAVKRAIERTGKATTTSALAMLGGFGSLMLSTFPVMRDFGFLALVAISFSLLSAFTVVPAFLMITERVSRRLNKKSVASFVSA
ncbi:MAG: MMPL family transporter, partial [Archaeoglobaceae archaeon]